VPGEGGTDVLVGRHRRVRLRLLSERWTPGEGVWFVADADGPVIVGHLTVRPASRSDQPGTGGGGVEVWAHLEVPRGRRARRVLRAVRSVTRAGLRRRAAHHGAA